MKARLKRIIRGSIRGISLYLLNVGINLEIFVHTKMHVLIGEG